jgi:hypothetical protein
MSTGSPAKVSEVPFDPGAIVGHVPEMAGRYWADGLSPPPPLLDPDELELMLASVMSPELEPELPLDPELPFEPELPLEPELPFEPELPLDPEPLLEPEELPELEAPEPPPDGLKLPSGDEPPQLAIVAKLVTAIPKTSVQRMASSVATSANALRTPPAN